MTLLLLALSMLGGCPPINRFNDDYDTGDTSDTEDDQDTVDIGDSTPTSCDSYEVYQDYTPVQNALIPVAHHIIRENNGSGGITQSEAESGTEILNSYFLGTGMQFYTGYVGEIHSSKYYSIDSDDEAIEILLGSQAIEGMVNVYFVDYVIRDNINGTATRPHSEAGGILIDNQVITENKEVPLPHEMGHYFNLYHTYEGFGEEAVQRTDCYEEGDYICDTPADPGTEESNPDSGCSYNEDTCEIIQCGEDENGETYQPATSNIMSRYPDQCRSEFTNQQIQMMNCGLQELRPYLDVSYDD